jgi:hypothetical protein
MMVPLKHLGLKGPKDLAGENLRHLTVALTAALEQDKANFLQVNP